jgi:hypothetical protein
MCTLNPYLSNSAFVVIAKTIYFNGKIEIEKYLFKRFETTMPLNINKHITTLAHQKAVAAIQILIHVIKILERGDLSKIKETK